MYCGACKRDVALAKGLRDLGHEVLIVPIYTPLRVEDPLDVPLAPLGFGGIRAFLAGSRLFGALPKKLRRALDHPLLVRVATSRATAVDASALGALTVGVLQGLDGPQADCWQALEEVLLGLPKPDWVTITNSMLGAATQVVERIWSVPCATFLQGEETFLHGLGAAHRDQAWRLVGRWANRCHRLMPTSNWAAAWWSERLELDPDRFAVVPPCLSETAGVAVAQPPDPRRVVCVGVLTPAKGQDLLVQAARALPASQGWSFVLAGRPMDRAFAQRLRASAASIRPDTQVALLGELDPWRKRWIQSTAGVGCMPSRIPEARGMAALEFLSYGVPAVVPDSGVFPEIAERVEGTILFETGSADSLASALERATHADAQSASARLRRSAIARELFSPLQAAKALVAALEQGPVT